MNMTLNKRWCLTAILEWIRHNARPPGHLRIVFAGQTTVLLVNKSGAICKFLLCVTATLPSMQPVTRFVH